VSETIADRHVHPATIVLRFLREAPRTLLAIPAGLAFMAQRGLSGALWIAAAVAIVGLLLQWLHWSRFRYGVGDAEIVIERGVLNRTRRSIPFDRIQDVDIERALLARLFGLAKVRIETGAGGKDEGVLDGVTMDEAARLRAVVRAWRDEAKGAAASPHGVGEAMPAGQRLFEMRLGRVLLYGLFNFSLVYIGGLFAFLQTFDDPLARWFGFDIYDPARWIGVAGDAAHTSWSRSAIGAVALLALLLGVILSVARITARDFDYRLAVEGDRFRRERGLFTRSEAVIAKRRVQLAYVETGPFRRMSGYFWLSFQTLGAGSDGSGDQAAAPFATPGEIAPILAEAGGLRLPPPPELAMVSQRHIVRALLRNLVLPTAAILIAAVRRPEALVLLALLPFLALHAALVRRYHRYAFDGALLFVRRGVWRQRLFVLPARNIQTVSIARTWLQRRLGLATLAIDTAGAPPTRAPNIVDISLETARALAAELAASARERGPTRGV
jgi:putative membrane protein